eukprot:TRINITY_DN3763_c0_g1_i1.p1 TRINITY_DN3763_c0_g1~~TRINITY_DN3763_c0_g1_i1.p1  ORF type:complete len:294 (-),score=77.23 TRINITY_DN3763_c0_g1_i1:122-1003(-)
MGDVDELLELRNYLYLGNYAAAVQEGNTVSPSNQGEINDRDVFVYRAYIGQGNYSLVFSEVNESSPIACQAVKLYASYKQDASNRDIVLTTLKEWLDDSASKNDPTLKLMAGYIYYDEGNFEQALKTIHTCETLEMHALMCQCFLRMDRTDLAQEKANEMSKIDDDSTLSQLATAWVNIATGNRVKESFLIFQELGDKYNPTAVTLTGQGVAQMHQGNFTEAATLFQEALSKSNNNAEALINLIVCKQHLGGDKTQVNRLLTQLKSSSPNHPWVQGLDSVEASFDRSAQTMAM